HFSVSFFIFLYLCRVVRSEAGRAEGGRQTYLKGVESTLYLRQIESRKFYPPLHGKAMFQCPWFAYIFLQIYT
ncbi:MAG: hypothetical protein K6A95_08125, partial [Bacteroidales bacterium]|nr:hypothetical protein [Bacteroidales bacterium]